MTEELPAVTREATVSLREVTRENLRAVLRLKVAPEQEKFVANNEEVATGYPIIDLLASDEKVPG